MIQENLSLVVLDAAVTATPELELAPEDIPQPELENPRVKEHGDWATNLALVLAPRAGRKPREVAEAVVRHLQPDAYITRIEIAGPGFINLFLGPGWLHDALREILDAGPEFGRASEPTGRKVQVEFVSANPTGPLHIGHARNAVLGDAIANLLEAVGDRVEREYYYNNAGRQMELFGRSVEARLLQLQGHPAELPEDGYAGDYIWDVAREIQSTVTFGPPLGERAADTRWRDVLDHAAPIMLHHIES